MLLGWNATGEYDAAATHLAKVRTILRYLDRLSSISDDDLVLIIDAYDVFLQLPVDIMLERYFTAVQAANERLEARYGGQAQALGLRQSILFGPDKTCWPYDARRPACWAVQEPHLPKDAYGPLTGSGDLVWAQPRWLNSGTVMGPVGDVRKLFTATLDRIQRTYDPDYEFRESDQFYLGDIYGEQEYIRSKKELEVHGKAGEPVPGGPKDRFVPAPESDQAAEFHMAIDYESAIFQTWAGYDRFVELLTYRSWTHSAKVTKNMFDLPNFRPYYLRLPTNVLDSLTRLLDSIKHAHRGVSSRKLIRRLALGTNLVTRHVYPLLHCTGAKDYLDELWGKLWFSQSGLTRPLHESAINKSISEEPLSPFPIDDRIWKQANPAPPEAQADGGGVWADGDAGWLPWAQLCNEHEKILFG